MMVSCSLWKTDFHHRLSALLVLCSCAMTTAYRRPVEAATPGTSHSVETRKYLVRQIGTPLNTPDPSAINEAGDVAGVYLNLRTHATGVFLYRRGRYEHAGRAFDPSGVVTVAGITRSDIIVGNSTTAGNRVMQACVWEHGKIRALDIPPGFGSMALAANASGTIVGLVVNQLGIQSAFICQGGKTRVILDRQFPHSAAEAVNQSNLVVGYAGANSIKAAKWENGKATILPVPGRLSHAFAVNASGEIAGLYRQEPDNQERAFVLNKDRFLPLQLSPDFPFGEARGINDAGDVVGTARSLSYKGRAFLYSHGKVLDLTSLISSKGGWVLEQAWGINNRGQIIAVGHRGPKDFPKRAVLLTPVTQ